MCHLQMPHAQYTQPELLHNQVVLLLWGVSQRDMEMAAKILSQICLAHESSQGTTIAVLSQREKLDMEAHFRRVLPDALRFGSRLVFRQGTCPLPCALLHPTTCKMLIPSAHSLLSTDDVFCWMKESECWIIGVGSACLSRLPACCDGSCSSRYQLKKSGCSADARLLEGTAATLYWHAGAGSPLIGEDLRMVAATSAAATIIVSDSSRRALSAA